jgi:hypothetical protein
MNPKISRNLSSVIDENNFLVFIRTRVRVSGKDELEATSHNEDWDENVIRIDGGSITLGEA